MTKLQQNVEPLPLPFMHDEQALEELHKICIKHGIEFDMLIEMLRLELEKRALQRRHNLFPGLNEIILNYIDVKDQHVH